MRSAECPWAAEPHGVLWNELLLADPNTILVTVAETRDISKLTEFTVATTPHWSQMS